MNNDRQVTLTRCDYGGKYYEACNAHKCKKQPQRDKYIPCTHCTVQQCKDCDYDLHKKAVGMMRNYEDNILSLQNHFRESEQNKESILDYETMTVISEALELVE